MGARTIAGYDASETLYSLQTVERNSEHLGKRIEAGFPQNSGVQILAVFENATKIIRMLHCKKSRITHEKTQEHPEMLSLSHPSRFETASGLTFPCAVIAPAGLPVMPFAMSGDGVSSAS